MRIAILGTRGIPNYYGGFEQYAELFAIFLVNKGWDVTVFNSANHPYKYNSYKSVHIKHIFNPEKKIGTIGNFIYDLGCILYTRKHRFDLVYQLGYTSSAIFNFLYSKETVVVTNMDGLEWKRTKYNKLVQRFLLFSEKLVIKKSNYLVADSIGIQTYLKNKYKISAYYSAYTADIPGFFDLRKLVPFKLSSGEYNLLIARLEPENNIETIIQANLPENNKTKLVIIGNIHTKYGKFLMKKYESDKVQFMGSIYDKSILDSLRHFSRFYFHGHSVGGTNPSLLEAMACNCNIVAHNNIFNKNVLFGNGLYFNDAADLNEIISNGKSHEIFFENAARKNLILIANEYCEKNIFHKMENQLQIWCGKESKMEMA